MLSEAAAVLGRKGARARIAKQHRLGDLTMSADRVWASQMFTALSVLLTEACEGMNRSESRGTV